jgi:hypothetical protein
MCLEWGMDILDTAIKQEDGVSNLAKALGVGQSVVSNWRARGIPRPWRIVLEMRYAQAGIGAPVPMLNAIGADSGSTHA